jgi:hypothetical protein
MNECSRFANFTSRRQFLSQTGLGLGALALSQLESSASSLDSAHHRPKAKRIIYLFQSGGPPQHELFDQKPLLDKRFNEDLPDSIRQNQRFSGMVSGQSKFGLQPSRYGFSRCGESGLEIGDLLPHTQKIADDLCLVRSMHTEAINHDPAITFLQTGSQQPGRPSFGSWLDYGLGSSNSNLPSFVVMTSVPGVGSAGQGLLARLWGAGFLPSKHQGVQLRGSGDPVLYLSDPAGITRDRRRAILDHLQKLNHHQFASQGDPETEARIAQYEMAFRMQSSVPDLADLSSEPESTWKLYGEDAKKPGTFARNCLLARRLAERGVNFIQLYHRGWDVHGGLTKKLPNLARETDQASAALVTDLKQRGLLEDTIVIWGGEFGRTCYAQGPANRDNYGRDHHGRCFSLWMAGGGIKPGMKYGATDDFGFNITENPIHVHDLHATLLHQLGVDHEQLTHRFQGRQYRLTDIHGKVMHDLLT